jgi:aspartate-semialdehyde dehydrogenase
MTKLYNIAIIGVTGAVGQSLLDILEERNFPVGTLIPIASEDSVGDTVGFKGKQYGIKSIDAVDVKSIDIAFFSAGREVSLQHAERFAKGGAVVIDNTTAFRSEDDVPLVVPEVNPEAIAQYKTRHIIANPNCSTIQMVVALKPIYDEVGITRINVCTYQSVSGTGKAALEELAEQTSALLNGHPVTPKVYPKQIAFNCLPQIDDFLDNGYTKEEIKMLNETQKIFGDTHIMVNATAVRVPVFFGHSEAVHLETRDKITAAKAKALLSKAPGVSVVDERVHGGYATPVDHASGQDDVFVSRIREDISSPLGLNLWIVADNIRKGAALNSIQIAEHLIRDYL